MDDMRQCSRCGKTFPATPEFFWLKKGKLSGTCVYCKREIWRAHDKRQRINKALPDGYKWCSDCQRTLPATPEFFSPVKSSRDGLLCYCKPCQNKRVQVSRSKKKAHQGIQASEASMVQLNGHSKSPVVTEEPVAILPQQCKACGTSSRNLIAEVDKRTAKQYGYLCMPCLKLARMLRDSQLDVTRMRSVLDYLEKTSPNPVY